MTTPSKYRRLNEAAELYMLFGQTTMQMCKAVKGIHGGLRFEGEVDTPEKQAMRDSILAVALAIETEFHKILDPYVEKLEEIDKAIRDNLPKPPGSIILPGDNN
jgi:hypothetical protein